MREQSSLNLNPEFAESIRENAVIKPIPSPEVGQIWQHRNGLLYRILLIKVEAAGELRHQNPSGYLHMYECMKTGKLYARLTDLWEKEMQSFKLIKPSKKNDSGSNNG